MSIAVKGDAIWSQFSSQINCTPHGRLRLVWKTKHQIMANRLIPYFSAHLSNRAYVFERLNAVDGLLYNRIIILDTETISGKSKCMQNFKVSARSVVRVGLKTVKRCPTWVRVFKQTLNQITQMMWRKESRCTSPKCNSLMRGLAPKTRR